MKLIQFLAVAALVAFVGFAASGVNAEGETVEVKEETKEVCHTPYGGEQECHTETTTHEEVVREVEELKDTGVVSNVALAAGLFGAGAIMLLVLQRKLAVSVR